MAGIDDAVSKWISEATDEQLREKLAVYEDTGNFGGRDAEMIARLKAQLRAELERRGNCGTA